MVKGSVPSLRPALVLALLALLTSAPSAVALQDRPAPPPGAPAAATVRSPDRVIVQWAPTADRGDRIAARAEAEVSFTATLGDPAFQLVEVRPGQSPREAVAELEASPAVAVAERDSYVATDAVPNDPFFGQLWGLRNQGLGVAGFSGAVAGADIDAVSAWDRTVGSPGVVVAVIDSGYRFEHPDLADVAWTNPDEVANGADDDGNGVADDLHGADFIGPDGEAPSVDGNPTDGDLISGGHGVHTAGTIGATGDNDIGITGVAQNVRIMPLRACSRFPKLEASRCSVASIVAAINYAGEEGARVANMSLGGTGPLPEAEANALAANPHVLYVVSAGNDGEDNDEEPRYPCNIEPQLDASPPVPGAIDNVVCVAATDQADGLADFSDWGETSVDLGAPGTETLSTYPFVTPLAEDFESAADFATAWPASGPDGGFERSDEAPLTSFGITDAVGAPLADTVRETTSAPFAVPPNGGCRLSQTRRVELGATSSFRYSVLLDGDELAAATPDSTETPGLERRFLDLPVEFKAGGSVQIRFRFAAGAAPSPQAGVWLDDLSLVCAQAVGEASAYAFLQGTSMAAPHVAGTAALLFSARPGASVSEVREALLGSVDPVPSLDGLTVTGGRLDAAAALESLDLTPPDAPLLTGMNPPSPSSSPTPRVVGAAEPGSTVGVFFGAGCAGEPLTTGSAAELQAPGILVNVSPGSTVTYSAAATDAAGNESACSAPIVNTRLPVLPPVIVVPPDTETPNSFEAQPPPPPPVPTCTVPKLAGKSLARAKTALAAASCKLGKVTKPKPRRGKRLPALVVKSSSPAAGALSSAPVNLTLGPKPKRKRH